jgi:hypothetical protein
MREVRAAPRNDLIGLLSCDIQSCVIRRHRPLRSLVRPHDSLGTTLVPAIHPVTANRAIFSNQRTPYVRAMLTRDAISNRESLTADIPAMTEIGCALDWLDRATFSTEFRRLSVLEEFGQISPGEPAGSRQRIETGTYSTGRSRLAAECVTSSSRSCA